MKFGSRPLPTWPGGSRAGGLSDCISTSCPCPDRSKVMSPPISSSGRARRVTRWRRRWPSGYKCLIGWPRSGGSIYSLTTSPILPHVRRARPTHLWRSVRTARRTPNDSSKACCSDRAGTFFSFVRREAGRSLAEAMLFLHKAKQVWVVVATHERPTEEEAVMVIDAVNHLRHH